MSERSLKTYPKLCHWVVKTNQNEWNGSTMRRIASCLKKKNKKNYSMPVWHRPNRLLQRSTIPHNMQNLIRPSKAILKDHWRPSAKNINHGPDPHKRLLAQKCYNESGEKANQLFHRLLKGRARPGRGYPLLYPYIYGPA